jgi:heavy metal sensor kinase
VLLRSSSIRTRLTLAYTAIFALLLGIYIGGASCLHYWQLSDQLYNAEVQDLETVEGLLYFTADGRLLLHDDYHSRPESRLLLDRLMEVLDARGQVLFRNEKLGNCDLGGPPLEHEFSHAYYARHLRLCDGTPVLSVSHMHPYRGRLLLLRVAYSTDPLKRRLYEFLAALVLAMPFALVVAGVAAYRMAGRAISPLKRMARATERITADKLSERIPAGNPNDELGHMARVLNGLLQRLEDSFENLKRFTSDVSHELRTPLASMRSVGEVALQGRHDAAEYRDIIGSMLEEVSKLNTMVDTLLTMAHADYGSIELSPTEFSPEDLVQESIGIVSVLAEEKRQAILSSGDACLRIFADRGSLRMVFINLLDNAVKYSPAGSTIRVEWRAQAGRRGDSGMVEVTVADQGPGVAREDRERVFERFYRVDEARDREAGGVGLGLAIAKWAVEANGGRIILDESPQGGALFRVSLPAFEPILSRVRIQHGSSI